MARPVVATVSGEVYDALGPWQRADAGTWDLLEYIDAMMLPLQDMVDIVRDTDDHEGWGRLLDVNAAPDYALAWLAQFVGVTPLRGLDPEAQRLRIREAGGFHRGSPAALVAAAKQYLTGRKTVQLYERDGSAWRFRMRVYNGEAPNPRAVYDAVQALKPAGLIFELEVQQGLAIDDVPETINLLAQTIESFSNTRPGDTLETSDRAYGVGPYGRGPYGGVL